MHHYEEPNPWRCISKAWSAPLCTFVTCLLLSVASSEATEYQKRAKPKGHYDIDCPFPKDWRPTIPLSTEQSYCRADLRDIDLSEQDLVDLDFRAANLAGAILVDANISGSDIQGANFAGANLRNANLRAVYGLYAKFAGAKLDGADLSNSNIQGANFEDAQFTFAVLRDATFYGSNFTNAWLREADLRGANLDSTYFDGADLVGTQLDGAKFSEVSITKSIFAPRSVPTGASLTDIRGLLEVQLHDGSSQHPVSGVTLLRNSLRKVGLRRLEREATYVIERTRTSRSGFPERQLRWILFEVTSCYGLYPSRPIAVVFLLIGMFAIVYIYPLAGIGRAAIVMVFPPERIDRDGYSLQSSGHAERLLPSLRWIPLWALYFSFLSAFQIGWRDLNVGNWVNRMQAEPYVLVAVGWPRTLSGVQSLLSVYLLALAVLSYFGSPFG